MYFKMDFFIMVLFRNGYKDLVHCKYAKGRVSAFIIDETVIQIGNQHFWFWFCIVLNQYTVQCLEFISLKREKCILLTLKIALNNTISR